MAMTEQGTRVLKTACYLCHGGCILQAHVKDGKLVKLEGDPDGPHNRGTICEKGNAAIQYIYSPYRLRYPLKRVGKRGEGNWQRISWEEALSTVAEKLRYYRDTFGGESIVYGWGTGRVIDAIPFKDFFDIVIGSPNGTGIGHLCLTKTRMPAMTVTVGRLRPPAGLAVNRDFERSNCIVGWGDLIIDSRNDYMGQGGTRIADALRRGCKLITIDPVYTRLAQKSDLWLPIRPGTDIALALAWQNVIINEGLYDRDFVEKWTNAPFLVRMDRRKLLRLSDIQRGGNADHFVVWDEVSKTPKAWNSEAVSFESANVKPALSGVHKIKLADGTVVPCQTVWDAIKENIAEWTPERAAEVTWLKPAQIRESAIMYAINKPACIEWGVAMSQCARSTATNQAILQLECITGNFDTPGGNACWMFPGFRHHGIGSMLNIGLTPEQEKKRVTGGFPFSSETQLTPQPSAWQPGVWKQIITGEPYPIKAYFGCHSNPLVGHEKPDRYVLEALREKLEFIVWADIIQTPSNIYADIILPVCSCLERDWLTQKCEVGILAGQKVVEPLYESKSDFYIYRELSCRLGREDVWPWKTEEEWCDWQLEELGIKFRDLTRTCFTPAPQDFKKYETGLLRKDGKPGFQTKSGKCELYSSLMEQFGLSPLPVFSLPLQSYEENPELARQYPLILITGSRELNYPFFHSQYRQIPHLREMQPFPLMMINPDTSSKMNIKQGNWVWVETPVGKARFKADVTPRIPARMVSVTHSWWYPELPLPYGVFESSCNVLVDPEAGADPATGTTELRGILCKVYKAEAPPPGVTDKDSYQ